MTADEIAKLRLVSQNLILSLAEFLDDNDKRKVIISKTDNQRGSLKLEYTVIDFIK